MKATIVASLPFSPGAVCGPGTVGGVVDVALVGAEGPPDAHGEASQLLTHAAPQPPAGACGEDAEAGPAIASTAAETPAHASSLTWKSISAPKRR